MTMEKEYIFTRLQEEWLEALEGGKYAQATGQLRMDDGYCCLGVACDLYTHGGWVGDGYRLDGVDPDYTDDSEGELPDEIAAAFGFKDTSGGFGMNVVYRTEESLIGLNDTQHLTFAEIATFVRQYPTMVFKAGDE